MSYRGQGSSWAPSHTSYGQRNNYNTYERCNDYDNHGRKGDSLLAFSDVEYKDDFIEEKPALSDILSKDEFIEEKPNIPVINNELPREKYGESGMIVEIKKSPKWYDDDLEEEVWYNDLDEDSKLDQHSDSEHKLNLQTQMQVEVVPPSKRSAVDNQPQLHTTQSAPLGGRPFTDVDPQLHTTQVHPLASGATYGVLPPTAFQPNVSLTSHITPISNMPFSHVGQPSQVVQPPNPQVPLLGKRPYTDVNEPTSGFQLPNKLGLALNKRSCTEGYRQPQNLQPPASLHHEFSKGLSPPVEEGIRILAEGPFAFVHPVDNLSKMEKNFRNIFLYNFAENDHYLHCEGTKKSGGVRISLYGILHNAVGFKKNQVLLGKAEAKEKKVAMDQVFSDVCRNLFKHCHAVKPNPSYYNDGKVPDFLANGELCHHKPPVYKVLKKANTGPLSTSSCRIIVKAFIHNEPYEDMFFHDSSYSEYEKEILISVVKEHRKKERGMLQWRKYGYENMDYPYICVYKKRLGIDIFKDVKYKRKGCHPKYIISEKPGATQIANNMILETDKQSKEGVKSELATDKPEIDSPFRGRAFVNRPNSRWGPPSAQDQPMGEMTCQRQGISGSFLGDPTLVCTESPWPGYTLDKDPIADYKIRLEKDIMKLANGPFAIMIPVSLDSETNKNPGTIFHYNFGQEKCVNKYTGSKKSGGVTVSLFVQAIKGFKRHDRFLLATNVGKTKKITLQACYPVAAINLVENCRVVMPNQDYYKNGGVPDFLKGRQLLDNNPPLYKVLTKAETGPLDELRVEFIFSNFKDECYEDLFFHDRSYSSQEQTVCKTVASNKSFNFGVRYYGEVGIEYKYICIYKRRQAIEVFNEVVQRKNSYHPKYLIRERPTVLKLWKQQL